MKWTPEAEKAVERAPFFVRKRVRKRVEEGEGDAGGREKRKKPKATGVLDLGQEGRAKKVKKIPVLNLGQGSCTGNSVICGVRMGR